MEAPDFFVEDLLDLPNGDDMMPDAFFDTSVAGNSTDSSPVTAVGSCNSSLSRGTDHHFLSDLPNRSFSDAGELCVPYDDLAELEWLSNFVEESFSSEGPSNAKPRYQARPGSEGPVYHHSSSPVLRTEGPVPGKLRSKLSRVAPSDWSTRVLMVSQTSSSTGHFATSSPAAAPPKKPVSRKRAENPDSPNNGEVRRCLHCAAEKTPQWRTGPMGPKTLCNACGVRYKSGRLVPEYRPAASPTFVSARHSNSHRKVLELRRQKDVHRQHHPQFAGHASVPGVYVGGGGAAGDEYLIHHHMGSDYRQLI
ncbi:hypothetical protein V2J09_011096 [Rumex salicifolius]